MRAPRFNRPLVLEEMQRAPDGAGGFVQVWQALGTLWVEVSARSGGGSEGEAVSLARATYRITTRAAPQDSPSRPKAGQRLRDGARVFSILAVTERDPEGRYLIVWAEEEVVA
ncbi:MAG: phage tail protein [Rhodobacteraceae bacterium CG17_big_fil_post_rev_8_21_14_2_50_63_15]|nr:head-tail adaptor protein [Roseovarius sp.]PIV79862.1 MAG: phage tail protein [Rhodobacteraceae bacterium CG17_big_fil_post_rev_8_21_14_2_50_63_15]